jgi:hypothetical protein
MKMNNKNYIKYFIITFFVFSFLFNISFVLASSITFSSGQSYRVGDTIQAKIVVDSDVSINAISANISYPTDKLSIISISKSGSIISLWAKEPSFSNVSGAAILEGIILNGFSGNNGNFATLIFKAKSEGRADLGFINASILANDGNGTSVPLTKKSIYVNILKAVLKPKMEVPVEKVTTVAQQVVEKCKEAVVQVREVEKVNNLPDYSLVVILLLVIVILLTLAIIYCIYYIRKLWNLFKKKISKTSNDTLNNLEVLKNDLNNEIIIADKIRRNVNLNSNEISFQFKLEEDVINTEEKIVKEIKEIETREE